MNTLLKLLGEVLAFIARVFVLTVAWNIFMPDVLGLPEITVVQSIALTLLIGLLWLPLTVRLNLKNET